MKETRHYSGLLYALADTLSDAAQAEEVREAASRLDLQTVGINEFRRQKEQAEKERDEWIDSHAKLHRKSSDRIAELERALEACRSDLEAATEACEELDGNLRAATTIPCDQLWAIHIPGPDDYYAAPSEETANCMAKRHNNAMADCFAKNPPNDFSGPVECCQAAAAPWPFDAESHAEELAEFDYAEWGIEQKQEGGDK